MGSVDPHRESDNYDYPNYDYEVQIQSNELGTQSPVNTISAQSNSSFVAKIQNVEILGSSGSKKVIQGFVLPGLGSSASLKPKSQKHNSEINRRNVARKDALIPLPCKIERPHNSNFVRDRPSDSRMVQGSISEDLNESSIAPERTTGTCLERNESQISSASSHSTAVSVGHNEKLPKARENQVLLLQKDWFFDKINRDGAEALLKKEKPGAFLVRWKESQTEDCRYSLSVYDRKIFHVKIRYVSNGQYAIGEQKTGEMVFHSMDHMIAHYKREKLEVPRKGENPNYSIVLTSPPKK